MDKAEKIERIMAIVHMRAAEVVKLPRAQREANVKAYTANLMKVVDVRDADLAQQLAAKINSMTMEMVAKIENSGGGNGGNA